MTGGAAIEAGPAGRDARRISRCLSPGAGANCHAGRAVSVLIAGRSNPRILFSGSFLCPRQPRVACWTATDLVDDLGSEPDHMKGVTDGERVGVIPAERAYSAAHRSSS
jgi:hypothetical protein